MCLASFSSSRALDILASSRFLAFTCESKLCLALSKSTSLRPRLFILPCRQHQGNSITNNVCHDPCGVSTVRTRQHTLLLLSLCTCSKSAIMCPPSYTQWAMADRVSTFWPIRACIFTARIYSLATTWTDQFTFRRVSKLCSGDSV